MNCKQCDKKLDGYTQSEEAYEKDKNLCTKCAEVIPELLKESHPKRR